MAPWNKRKGPTRVKRRWESGRLCREKPLCLRPQRYGSHDGEWRCRGDLPGRDWTESIDPEIRQFFQSNVHPLDAGSIQPFSTDPNCMKGLVTIEMRTIHARYGQVFSAAM